MPKNSETLYHSEEAQRVKKEIVQAGQKLWQRAYVDGNGGNISHRISEDYVLCTPTMRSKADLCVEEICMVDLQGNQVAGPVPRTSEILLHLEIMKAQPLAKACVHAHPPYATMFAVTGQQPPRGVTPESEIFVGQPVLVPYGTPGTLEIAAHVKEVVQDHNAIILENHGVICWAESVTIGEWCIEVLETLCSIVAKAASMGAAVQSIPNAKLKPLLDLKKSLNIPDPLLDD